MSLRRTCLALAILASALNAAGQEHAPPTPPVHAGLTPSTQAEATRFRRPELPLEERVADLISRLTTEEKITQLGMENTAIPRLGIPAYHWWNEGLHGVARNGVATVFPQAIGLAATWNPELHRRVAEVVATEARAKFHETVRRSGGDTRIYEGLTIWSPNINIFRDPRWGRGQETYGEDPLLAGLLGVAFCRGLQGDDPRFLKTVATLKHFAVHSGPETPRHRFDAVVSARDLRDTYLPAFEMGVRDGGATSVMSAYNAVNGVPAPANRFLLDEVLRAEWGFTGAVVGDVGTVADLHNERGHRHVADAPTAIAAALRAGNDLCSDTTYRELPEALRRGLVDEADLDRALRRLFTLRFRLGLFDPPANVPYAAIPATAVDAPEHDRLALETARQSLVLLKNDGTLPWNPRDFKSVAILGPTGDDYAALIGNYAGTPARPMTLARALRAKLEAHGVRVTFDSAIPLVAGFREAGQPFATGTLFTDETRTVPGLRRERFAGPDFAGPGLDPRVEPQLDLFWNPAQPVPGLPVENVCARWTGVLVPPTDGDYEFALSCMGVARLFVDDQPVAGFAEHPRSTHNAAVERVANATLRLRAGQSHRLRIEYQQRPGTSIGRIQLGWRPPGGLDAALAQARAADRIILTLGITPALEGEEMKVSVDGFTGGDRTSIRLPKIQCDLIDAVAALGKPFVVILCNGSALAFDTAKPNAILEAWYYGQRGGEAVAEVLLGETNPSGRLPITFYRRDADLPPFEDYAMAGRTYRYFAGEPLFAFGHGLGYTTFAYEGVALDAPTKRAIDTLRVAVTLRNSGTRDGDEVVQLYATAPGANPHRPLRQLVGFQRITLRAGETGTAVVAVPLSRLRLWDETLGAYTVAPGAYHLVAGPSSDRPQLATEVRIEP